MDKSQVKKVTGITVPSGLSADLRPIGEEVHRLHESTLWSAQTQFEQLKRWRGVHYWVGVLAAVLAALAGAGGLAKFHIWWIPPLLALAAAALGAVLTTLNPAQKAAQARAAATEYQELQTEARQLLTIDLKALSKDEARERLSDLTGRRDSLNKTAEPPGSTAYKKAKRLLEAGGQSYEQDAGAN
jgi:hypothetical protein